MSYKRKSNIITTTIIGAIILLGIGGNFTLHGNKTEYKVIITDKQVKRKDKSDKYLIFTKTENGETRVFENTDSLIEMKFNSSDVYAELEIGKEYTIKTYGYRIPMMSSYENIIEVKNND